MVGVMHMQVTIERTYILTGGMATSISPFPQKCPLCHYLCPSLVLYISHLRLVHNGDPTFNVSCPIDCCEKPFSTFSAFNSHIYRDHRAALGLDQRETEFQRLPEASAVANNTVEFSENENMDSSPGRRERELSPQPVSLGTGINQEQQQKESAKFILKLREIRGISQVAVIDVVEGCQSLFQNTLARVKEGVRDKLSHSGIDYSDVGELDSVFDLPDPFEALETIYLQDTYFKEHFHYLEPREVCFGNSYYVNRFSGKKRQKTLWSDKFYYIPMLETLKQLLSHRDILHELDIDRQNGELLTDYCDGTLYKEHPLFGSDPHSLQIVAYYDDLEVCNPIGSYVHTHKLGCLFFTLGNIRPQYRSSLKAIFLLGIAKSQDIKEYGIDAFLEPFVEDLKSLYLDGLTIDCLGQMRTVYGGLLAFLADTLAAHAVGGFKESMSFALRICRSCMITTDDAQDTFCESECELRTPELHLDQCQLSSESNEMSTWFGINRTSILEEVPGFSVVTGLPHDIMHDLFEGFVHYELKLLLSYCVRQQKYFTIKDLNHRISVFDFGEEDRPSFLDPAMTKAPNERSIRQSAAQTITLIKYLPLLLGDTIPEDDQYWYSFLLLIKICKIALSPIYTPDTVPHLRVLVEEKLLLYRKLYPEMTLKPKMHYLLHYPSQIEQYGPLIHSWTMRHEAKLSFMKRAAKSGNNKNVCKSVAKHHQFWLSYQLSCEPHLLYSLPLKSPKGVHLHLCNEPQHVQAEIIRLQPSVTPETEVFHPNWVNIQSSTYHQGVFVLLNHDDMNPKFGKVVDLIMLKDPQFVCLCVEIHAAKYFCSHYNAFVIKSRVTTAIVPIHSLPDHYILRAHRSFDTSDVNLYISVQYLY